jgi:hypothetical protein
MFSVAAEGTPVLHYQWFFNGGPLDGAADPVLTLTNVQAGQAGSYFVVVSNQLGMTISPAAELSLNHPPIADASATPRQVIACNNAHAKIVLDGSRSSDPDGDPLQYAWYVNEGAHSSATGVVAVVALRTGTNIITLNVSDGWATNQQSVTVEVITAAQAVERLMADVSVNVPGSRPLLATLGAARAAICRGSCLAAQAELKAFQLNVRAQVGRRDPALAASLIGSAQKIVDAIAACCRGRGRGLEQIFPRISHVHGKVHLEFPVTQRGIYLIEASSDLVHWEEIGVASDRNDGNFEFEDPNAAQKPARFYRIVSP